MLDEYLTFCKADFWRSVRNRSKQEHNKNTCDVQWFVFFVFYFLIEMVPRNGSGRVSLTDLSWSVLELPDKYPFELDFISILYIILF